MMINKSLVVDVEQGSEEWIHERLGVITASEFNKIITSRGAVSSSANTYMGKLIAEKITGEQQDIIATPDTERGKELEPKARMFFNLIKNMEATEVGMVYKDKTKTIACSPDGVIDYKIGLEIKCPKLATHIGYVLDGKMPAKYKPQVQGSMWVTGLDEWWFMSYHPEYEPLILKVKSDEEFIEKMDKIINVFNERLQGQFERIKQ